MRKYLFKLISFALLFFTLEKGFYVFLHFSPTLETDTRLERVLNGQINKDLLVFGSSRGARNIIAGQIEDSLGLKCFNLSYLSSDIEFALFMLQTVLKFNKAPKIILLAIHNKGEFKKSNTIKFRYDCLYPLAKYNYINNEMIKRKKKSFLSNFLVLSRINRSNIRFKKKHFSELDSILPCGSMPISTAKKDKIFNYNNQPTTYDSIDELPLKIEAFKKFQQICIENKITLILVFPPLLSQYNIAFEQRIRKFSRPEFKFHFYDTTQTLYNDKSFYHDDTHLKKNGAIVFTNELIRFLKQKNLDEEK